MKCTDCGYLNTSMTAVCICGKPTGFQARVKEVKPKQKSKIKPVSDKRKEENSLYSLVRAFWLLLHPICQFKGCEREATDLHHVRGRVGFLDDWAREHGITLLIDIRKFIGLCRDHHSYIEEHPEFAKKEGYSENRL